MINDLIARLMAIECFAKDIHYTCNDYAAHLLADKIHEGIEDFIDDLKENCFLGQRKLPLASKEYMLQAVKFIPDVKEKDRESFISLWGLIDDTRRVLKEMTDSEDVVDTRGTNALLDNIGEHLDKSSALIYLQTKHDEGLNEAEEDKENKKEEDKKTEELKDEKEVSSLKSTETKNDNEYKSTGKEEIEIAHDHKACTETPVDRKEFKQEEQEPSPSQKTALKYSKETVMVAESETNVDKLVNKIKELGL